MWISSSSFISSRYSKTRAASSSSTTRAAMGTAETPLDDWNLLPFQMLKSETSTAPSALKSPPHHSASESKPEFLGVHPNEQTAPHFLYPKKRKSR